MPKTPTPNACYALRYNGDTDRQWLPGVPARDMTAAEILQRQADPDDPFDASVVLATGWYEIVAAAEVEHAVVADRDANPVLTAHPDGLDADHPLAVAVADLGAARVAHEGAGAPSSIDVPVAATPPTSAPTAPAAAPATEPPKE